MDLNNLVEIELINKKRTLLVKNWRKVYNIYENTRWLLRRASTFPFFKFEKKRYVKFRFRTHYDTIDDFRDPEYKANCTLLQFAALFDASVTSFEKTIVRSDLEDC